MRPLRLHLAVTALAAGLPLAALAAGGHRMPPAPDDAIPGTLAEMADFRSASRLKDWRTFQASGYDRGDGFYDSGNFLREEPERHYVMLDTRGPGCIDRMWFTRKSVEEPWDLLIYLDGALKPTVRIGLDELMSEADSGPVLKAPYLVNGFHEPLVGSVDLARFSYLPIAFARSCKAVLVPTAAPEKYSYRENSAGRKIPHVYYQITYRRLPSGSPVREYRVNTRNSQLRPPYDARSEGWETVGRPLRDDLTYVTIIPNRISLKPGRQDVLFETGHPGVIRHLWIRPVDGVSTQRLWLDIFWDGTEKPAVSAPLGVFFAAPDPRVEVKGLWVGSRQGEYYCALPMPFRKSARIVVRSEADHEITLEARVDVSREVASQDDAYLHAQRYDHQPPLPKEDYVVLDTKGRGHWIGLVMDRPGNMEGDDRFYVDGEREPSIHGTGTEDFFNFAWGFGHIASLPLHGISRHFGAPILYRFHLPAAVPFRRSLRLTFEHGNGNEHQGRYSGVAFYYSDRPAGDTH